MIHPKLSATLFILMSSVALFLAWCDAARGAGIAPSMKRPSSMELVPSPFPASRPSRFPMNEVVETTIIFNSKATDGDMAILDTHPEIKTIAFMASAVVGPGSGGYMDLQITDAGFAHIAKATNLETLIFDPKRPLKVSDNALQSLVGLKIKILHLGATKFTAQGLAVLSKLEALDDFSADACAAADVCAAAGNFPHLRILTLAPYQWDGTSLAELRRRSYPSDQDIKQLAALSELEELYLDDSPLTDAIVPTLLKFTKLRVLHVQKSQLTDAGMAQLSKLSKLEELNLNGTAITDRAMDTIAGFSALKTLYIDKTQVTDEGLAKLTNLPQLVSLSARYCQIEGTGFSALAKSTKLEYLALQNSPVTDEGIKSLPILPKLSRIMLQKTSITDACLPHLAQFPTLDFINAMNTNLTDAGMSSLAAMEPLRTVWVNGTKVTARGAALIKQATVSGAK